MNRFAAALSTHPDSAEAVGEACGHVFEVLEGDSPDMVVLFITEEHASQARDIARAIREILSPVAVIGCAGVAVIGGTREVEEGPALSIFAGVLPGAAVTSLALETVSSSEGMAVVGWPATRIEAKTLILLADPYSFPVDSFLGQLNQDMPDLKVIGGLASLGRATGENRFIVDDLVCTTGAVGLLLDGGTEVKTVVSQGCRPIGRPFTVTKSEENVIYELAGQPALDRLKETVLAETEMSGSDEIGRLHIGRVVNEQKEEFQRGDFLVRNLVGVEETTGALAIGDFVEVGQTVQFHVRDSSAADEDLHDLLAGKSAGGALLFTCNGRGEHFFGTPDHDARTVDEELSSPQVAGYFCAGELGPIGGKNFVHGYTASLALFE